VIYIKDEDKWEEEGENKTKIKATLEEITKKSIKTLPEVKFDDDDEYVKTVTEILKNPREDNKIITEVAKNITL
jgi:hypothetical protein